MTGHLRIERAAPLMQVTLDRPAKLNAISDAMLEGLKEAVAAFAADRQARVLLVAATGRHFCAGAELGKDISPDVGASTLDGRAWYRHKWHSLFDAMEAVENPSSSSTRGRASAAGWRCRSPAISAWPPRMPPTACRRSTSAPCRAPAA